MLLDFRQAKNTRLAARVFFLRFSQVSQRPACLDQSIQTWKTIWYFFNPNTWDVAACAFFTLFERDASLVFGSQYPAQKNIWYFFNPNEQVTKRKSRLKAKLQISQNNNYTKVERRLFIASDWIDIFSRKNYRIF